MEPVTACGNELGYFEVRFFANNTISTVAIDPDNRQSNITGRIQKKRFDKQKVEGMENQKVGYLKKSILEWENLAAERIA